MFEYELKNGIGVLVNQVVIDLSVPKKIEFKLPIENGTLKIEKNVFDIKDFKAIVPSSKLIKGTNLVSIVLADKTIPLQPLSVFASNDKLECTLACAVDLQRSVNSVVESVTIFSERLSKVESYNLAELVEKVNLLIQITNDLQVRITEMEKGYDPTLIKN